MPPLSLKTPGQGNKRLTFKQRAVLKCQAKLSAVLNGSAKGISKVLIVLAVIEFVLFIATIVTSAMQTDTVSMSRDLTYAVIGLVSALFGIFGAKQLDRGVLLLYFVLVVWGIASSTSNINSNFLEQSKQSDICTHELTQEAQDADEEALGLQACTVQLALLTVKLVVIAINVVLQVISGWMALRLSEQIQEEEEGQEQQKQIQTNMDINFRRTSMMVGAGRRKGSSKTGMAVGGGAAGGLAAFGKSGGLAAFGAK